MGDLIKDSESFDFSVREDIFVRQFLGEYYDQFEPDYWPNCFRLKSRTTTKLQYVKYNGFGTKEHMVLWLDGEEHGIVNDIFEVMYNIRLHSNRIRMLTNFRSLEQQEESGGVINKQMGVKLKDFSKKK